MCDVMRDVMHFFAEKEGETSWIFFLRLIKPTYV